MEVTYGEQRKENIRVKTGADVRPGDAFRLTLGAVYFRTLNGAIIIESDGRAADLSGGWSNNDQWPLSEKVSKLYSVEFVLREKETR